MVAIADASLHARLLVSSLARWNCVPAFVSRFVRDALGSALGLSVSFGRWQPAGFLARRSPPGRGRALRVVRSRPWAAGGLRSGDDLFGRGALAAGGLVFAGAGGEQGRDRSADR